MISVTHDNIPNIGSTYTSNDVYHNSTNTYAEKLFCLLKNVKNETYCQPIHFTIGQIETPKLNVFEFQTGTPLIKLKSAKSEWVDRIWQLCLSKQEDLALKEIAKVIARFKVTNEFNTLSNDLLSINLNTLPDVVIIALLRNTFSIRAHISSWKTLNNKIEQILQERNRDTRILLRGLNSFS